MKLKIIFLQIFLFIPLFWFGCSKQTIEPEFLGSIAGRVQNSDTGEGIPNASITTNPGTDAILTDSNGEFSIQDVPTGNYTIQAEKENYKSNTVRVSVKEDRTANAQILLTTTANQPSSNIINTEVVNFFNTSRNDSSFVEAEFIVTNISENISVNNYEVYFKILTNGNSFFVEFEGDSLNVGQKSVGDFTKYIRKFNAKSVVVSGMFVPSE